MPLRSKSQGSTAVFTRVVLEKAIKMGFQNGGCAKKEFVRWFPVSPNLQASFYGTGPSLDSDRNRTNPLIVSINRISACDAHFWFVDQTVSTEIRFMGDPIEVCVDGGLRFGLWEVNLLNPSALIARDSLYGN